MISGLAMFVGHTSPQVGSVRSHAGLTFSTDHDSTVFVSFGFANLYSALVQFLY